MQLTPTLKGYSLASLATLLMSFFPLTFKLLGEESSANSAIATMFIMSFLFSFPTIIISKSSWKVSRWGLFWITTVLMASWGGNWFYFIALKYLTPGIAGALQRTELIFAAILGIIFLKEKIGYAIIIAIAASLIGISFLQGTNDLNLNNNSFYGILVSIASAFAFACMLFFSKFALRHTGTSVMNTYRLIGLTIILLSEKSIFYETLNSSWYAWGLAGLCAFAGPFGGRASVTYALNFLPMTKILLVNMLAPVLSIVWQWWFLDINVTFHEIIGALLIISGVCFMVLQQIWQNNK